MSDRTNTSDNGQDPLDVSRRSPFFQWIFQWIWLAVLVMLIFVLSIYFLFPTAGEPKNRPVQSANPWTYLVIAGVIVAVVLWAYWLNRWMFLARRPTKYLARGRVAAALSAYKKAIVYARRLAPDDHRRGIMLTELAGYLAYQGRRTEARDLFEESIAILEKCQLRWRYSYFIALNNLAVFYVNGRSFGPAQAKLEAAIDCLPLLKKIGQPTHDLNAVLCVNLAFLLLNGGELQKTRSCLDEAERMKPKMARRNRQTINDVMVGIRCLLECAANNYDGVPHLIEGARNQIDRNILSARAKVHLAREQFTEADSLLRESMTTPRFLNEPNYPENFEAQVDLAEAQFGQGKHDEAIATFLKARQMVAEFQFPPDDLWRTAMATWRQRAADLGQVELASLLDQELAKALAMPPTAITVLDRFHACDNDPEYPSDRNS